MQNRAQKRRGRGSSVGGQYAPDPRPEDPDLGEPLAVVSEWSAEAGALPVEDTIEVVLPNLEPMCLEQRNGKWDVQETWATSEVGLQLMSASTSAADAFFPAKRALEGLLRGQVVAGMLNDGTLSVEDAPRLLERLDVTWGIGNPMEVMEATADSFTPDSLWGARWVAAARGRHALTDLSALWERPHGGQPANNWERLSLRVKETWQQAKGAEPSMDAIDRAAPGPGMQLAVLGGQLDLLWEKCHKDKEWESRATLDDLAEMTGLGSRVGTPSSLDEIHDLLVEAGANSSDVYGGRARLACEPWMAMSKAHAAGQDDGADVG